jgi:hypothetical protein
MFCYIDHMSAPMLTAEVWDQLDPAAGRLSTRSRVTVLILFAAAFFVAAAVLVAWHLNAFTPNNYVDLVRGDFTGDGTTGHARLVLRVHNYNGLDEHITGLHFDSPGATMTSPRSLHLTVPAHHSRRITVVIQVADCALARKHKYTRIDMVTAQLWWHRSSMLVGRGAGNGLSTVARQACNTYRH